MPLSTFRIFSATAPRFITKEKPMGVQGSILRAVGHLDCLSSGFLTNRRSSDHDSTLCTDHLFAPHSACHLFTDPARTRAPRSDLAEPPAPHRRSPPLPEDRIGGKPRRRPHIRLLVLQSPRKAWIRTPLVGDRPSRLERPAIHGNTFLSGTPYHSKIGQRSYLLGSGSSTRSSLPRCMRWLTPMTSTSCWTHRQQGRRLLSGSRRTD